jgi:predicted negative regulator of RcsB-dependent stress response
MSILKFLKIRRLMEFLSWRNLVAVLIGAVVAGFIIGSYQLYKQKKREELGEKLYKFERLLYSGKVADAEKLAKTLPDPTASYCYLALGDYFYNHNSTERAIESFKTAAKDLRDNDKALYYYAVEKLAYLLYLGGEYKRSLAELSAIPDDAPDRCSANLLRAEDYLALGEKKNAKILLDELSGNCPDKDISLTAQYLLTLHFK